MKLLGVYFNFNELHPLWHTQQLRQKYDYSILTPGIYSHTVAKKIDPDVIITDFFSLNSELHADCGTILLVTEDFFQVHHGLAHHEIVGGIKRFNEIISSSLAVSKKLLKDFETESKVIYPIIDGKLDNNAKYIVYDERHPYAGHIQANLRKEHLLAYSSISDLNQAKLFLPRIDGTYDGRVPYAVCAGVPIVCNNNIELTEFLEGTGVLIDGNYTKDTWLHATKSMLRDRILMQDKLKTISNRYKDMGHLEDKIKRALASKPTKHVVQPQPHIVHKEIKKEHTRIINQRLRRHSSHMSQQYSTHLSQNIFLTGGVGDVLALDSFMSEEQKMVIHTICYATNKQSIIETLFRAVPNYVSLQRHLIVYNDFTNFWCFSRKEECAKHVGPHNVDFNESDDWGIIARFPMINMGLLKYNQSSFLNHHLTDLIGFQLPPNYYAICPYSTDKRIHSRDFDDRDWAVVIYKLIKSNMKGVVLNTGNEYVPDNPVLVNLSNKTSILEAIEILKRAKGYIGIDSSLSVLAAKLFDYPQLIIKSQNDHCYNNKSIYYAPKTDFNFLGPHIDKLLNI